MSCETAQLCKRQECRRTTNLLWVAVAASKKFQSTFRSYAVTTFTRMAISNAFTIREIFTGLGTKDLDDSSKLEEVGRLIGETVVRTVASELAWAVYNARKTEQYSNDFLTRIAFIFKHAKSMYSESSSKSIYLKYISILNDTCNNLLDCSVESFVCLTIVSIFFDVVFDCKTSMANCMLNMLSFLSIPPENTGHRRLSSCMKKGKLQMLIEEATRYGNLDFKEANEAFARSPSLKTAFITQFQHVEKQGIFDSVYANKVRSFLGLATLPDSEQCNDMTIDDVSEFTKMIEEYDDEKVNAILENVLSDATMMLESPSSTTASKNEEASTPPRKKAKYSNKNKIETVPGHHKLLNLSKINGNDRTITSYFKIEKGAVTHVVKTRATQPQSLLCYEEPLRNTEW